MSEQQHIINTFSEMSSRYEKLMDHELGLFWGYSYKEFVQAYLRLVNIKNGQSILDIATGTGVIPAYLMAHPGDSRNIVGLDLTFQMLQKAKSRLQEIKGNHKVALVCASAQEMPFCKNSFDTVLCCLATHHMAIDRLLFNIKWVKKEKHEGNSFIADVGGSSKWKIGIIRFIIKSLAFIYFLIFENLSRALAESDALKNVRTAGEWTMEVKKAGFSYVEVKELKSRRIWAPNPIIIKFY